MSKPIITFFTIAYNDENYISKSIESVLNQTFADFEYYIRDNGSTDSTYQIIQDYAKKDKRIKVFHNEQNGVFEIYEPYRFPKPQSEYLTILDSDDFIHPEYAERLIALAKQRHAEVVVAGTKMFQDGAEDLIISINTPVSMVYNAGDRVDVSLIRSFYGQLRPLWGKVYKTDFFYDKFATWFDENPEKTLHAADTVISISLLNQANTVVFCSDHLHYYRIKGQSKFKNYTPDYTRIFDLIEIYDLGIAMLQRMYANSNEGIQFIQSVARGHIKDIVDMMIDSDKNDITHKRQFLDQLMRDKRILDVEAILGYDGVIRQLKPLITFINQWTERHGVDPKQFTDVFCYAKSRTHNVLNEKLLMIYLIYSKDTKCDFIKNELYFWNNAMRIPHWYIQFCAFDEHQRQKWVSNKTQFIEFIQTGSNREDMGILKNQILDWIDQGKSDEAEYLIQQLLDEQPLEFHLLYLRLYMAAIQHNTQILNETWILLNAFYNHENEMMLEVENIYRSSYATIN